MPFALARRLALVRHDFEEAAAVRQHPAILD
jgi:hypothetical protein